MLVSAHRAWLHAGVQLLGLGVHLVSCKVGNAALRTLAQAAIAWQPHVALCLLYCAAIYPAVTHAGAIQ